MSKRNPNGYGCVTKLSGKRSRPYVVKVTVYDAEGNAKQAPVGYAPTKTEALILLAQYNIAQTLYLWEKFSLYTLTKSVKIPSISNKLGTDFTVVRVPQIDPSVALFPV